MAIRRQGTCALDCADVVSCVCVSVCSVETLTDIIVRGVRKSECHEQLHATVVVDQRARQQSWVQPALWQPAPLTGPTLLLGGGVEREQLCQLAMLLAVQLGEEAKELAAALQPVLLTLAKDPSVKVTERTMVCAAWCSTLAMCVCVCVWRHVCVHCWSAVCPHPGSGVVPGSG